MYKIFLSFFLFLIAETFFAQVIKNKSNNFGEEKEYYTREKRVIIYDFNAKPNRRRFYIVKMKLKKGDTTLITKPINPNKRLIGNGKDLQFRIVNVNRFLYDVSLSDSLMEYDSNPSPLLQSFFLGDTSGNGLIGRLGSSFPASSTPALTNNQNLEAYYGFVDQTLGLLNLTPHEEFLTKIQLQILRDSMQNVIDSLNTIIRNSTESSDKIKIQITQIKMQLREFYNEYLSFKKELLPAYYPFPCNFKEDCCNMNDYSNLIDSLYKINGSIFSLDDACSSLKPSIECINNKALLKKLIADTSSKQSKSTKEKNILKSKPINADSIKQVQKKNKNQIDSLNMLVKNCHITNNPDTLEIIKLYDSIKVLQKKLPTAADIKKQLIFYANMIDHNQTYSVDFIDLRGGNRLDLTLDIKTKDTLVKLFSIPFYHNQLSMHIPVIWGPFVNFSAGTFYAFGNNLRTIKYAWQALPNSSNVITGNNGYILVQNAYSSPPAGFSALANFGWKFGGNIGIGASAGVGLTIESNPRLAYLIGGSLYFGNLRQFTVTGGLAIMQIDKLTSNLQAIYNSTTGNNSFSGIQYATNPGSDAITYYKQVGFSPFLSVSYTLFKVKNEYSKSSSSSAKSQGNSKQNNSGTGSSGGTNNSGTGGTQQKGGKAN